MDVVYLREVLASEVSSVRWLAEGNYESGDLLEVHAHVASRIRDIAAAAEAFIPGHGAEIIAMLDSWNYVRLQDLILQAIHEIDNGAALKAALGPGSGAALRGDSLHPTVWDAAASPWRSNHRRHAISAAAVAVNTALQHRMGRTDCSNVELWTQSFSLDEPGPDKPRLRVHPDDGSETYRSMQIGAMSFGRGCFQALRNTGAAHTLGEEPSEHEALEQLAAFSIMARWVESGEVIYASGDG